MILAFFRSQWRIRAERYSKYGKLREIGINFFLTELALHRARIIAETPAEIPGIDFGQLRREFEGVDPKSIPLIPESPTALFVEIVEYRSPGEFRFRLVSLPEATERLYELTVDLLKEARRLEREVEGMAATLSLAQPRDLLLHGRPEIFEFQRLQRVITVINWIEEVTHLRFEVGDYNFFNKSDLRIEFSGAWGETRRHWCKSGWNPESWIPLPEQLAFTPSTNHATSKELKTFYWNVGGIDNPVFGELLQYFFELTRPSIALLTETWVSSSRARAIFEDLRIGRRLIAADGGEERGGVVLLYDPLLVDVFPLPQNNSQFHCIVIDKRAKDGLHLGSSTVQA